MDLALNNLQRLICHKTQQTKPNTLNIPTQIYPGPYRDIHIYIPHSHTDCIHLHLHVLTTSHVSTHMHVHVAKPIYNHIRRTVAGTTIPGQWTWQ